MKSIYKILMCLLLTTFYLFPLYSQSGFNKIVGFEGDRSNNFDGIQFWNDKLYVVGNTLIDSVILWGQTFMVLDTFGNILSQRTYLDQEGTSHIVNNSPSGFLFASNKDVVIPFYYHSRNNLGLLILDSLGTMKTMKEYPNSQYTIYPHSILEYERSYYLFGIIHRNNYQNDNYVLKTDSSGIFKWIKYYGSLSNNEYFGNVIDNKDGTFTISSATSTPSYGVEPYGSEGWQQPWIFTIDTSGAKISEWRGLQNDPNTLGGGPIYKMGNGDWFVISREWKYNTQHHIWFSASTPTITKFDSLFNKEWKLYLGNYTGYWDELLDLKFDSVNNVFVAGGHRIFYYTFDNGELEAWIVKFTPDGQIMLNTSDTILSDPVNGVMHFAGGMTLSPSGSIYMDGYVNHLASPSRQYGWIVKMTPDGCIDTLCITTPVDAPLNETEQISIYPNPANDFVNISCKEPIQSLSIYNIMGHLVYSQSRLLDTISKIDVSQFNCGLYLISVKVKDGFIITNKFVVS